MIRVTWAGAAAIIGVPIGLITGALVIGVAYLIYRAARYIWRDYNRKKEEKKDGR